MLEGFTKIPNFPFEAYEDLDTDLLTLGIYVHLLRKAAIVPTCAKINGAVVKLDRGQLVTGRRKLAAKFNVSEKRVRTALGLLQDAGAISIKGASLYSIITITSDKMGPAEGQRRANAGPTKGQRKAHEGPTEGQPRASAGPQYKIEDGIQNIEDSRGEGVADAPAPAASAPASNSRKGHAESQTLFEAVGEEAPAATAKREEYKKEQIPSGGLDEVIAYFEEKGFTDVSKPERFFDYEESVGWSTKVGPLKDWRAAARTWHGNDLDKRKAPAKAEARERTREEQIAIAMTPGSGKIFLENRVSKKDGSLHRWCLQGGFWSEVPLDYMKDYHQ